MEHFIVIKACHIFNILNEVSKYWSVLMRKIASKMKFSGKVMETLTVCLVAFYSNISKIPPCQ